MGDCHYLYGNYTTEKRVRFLKQLLAFSGIHEERLQTGWISSAEGAEFAEKMDVFVKNIRSLGSLELAEYNRR